MAINIELFVHGVPYGQKIWGPKGKEEQYLSSFYGPKWDTEVMKVDFKTFAGDVPQCYYSFIKGQNVCDSDGRLGGYFALTVRINVFYADVQNMYNILKAIYDKICVGLCVQEKNGTIQFLRNDFQSIDGKLKEIKEYLLNYLGLFSTSNDIVSLNGFTAKGEVAATSVNLLECTKSFAVNEIRKCGKIMVSAYYPTTKEAKTIAQYQAKIQTLAQQAQQEIQLANKSAQEKIDITTRQANERIDSLIRKNEEEIRKNQEMARNTLEHTKNEYERRIEEIKKNYADADIKMNALRHSISKYEKDLTEWKLQCNEKDKTIHKYHSTIQTLQQEVNKTNNVQKTLQAKISDKDTLINKLQQNNNILQQEIQKLRKKMSESHSNPEYSCANANRGDTALTLGTTKSFSEAMKSLFLKIKNLIVKLFCKYRKDVIIKNTPQPVAKSDQIPNHSTAPTVPDSQQLTSSSSQPPKEPVALSVQHSQQPTISSVQQPQQPVDHSVPNTQVAMNTTLPTVNDEDSQFVMRDKGLVESNDVIEAMAATPQEDHNEISNIEQDDNQFT